MSPLRAERRLDDLGRALARLREALAAGPENPLAVDATIQRFAFTFWLTWKTLKRLFAHEGFEVTSPREALRRAYAFGWLDDEAGWLNMLDDRNRTSHTYDEATAAEIYAHVGQHARALDRLHALLVARYP